MKKIVSHILCAAIACICLVGCGGDSKFVGKWECTKMSENGKTIENELMGVPLGAFFQFEFKSGGKGYLSSFTTNDDGEAGTEKTDLTWKEDGDTITITVEKDGEEDSVDFKLSDGKLVGSFTSNSEVTFKKVDSFTEFDFEEYKKKLLGGDE